MTAAPTEIRLKKRERALHLAWPDGARHVLPAELLRVYSPSAEVRGHGEGQRILQTGKKHVAITGIAAVGNYAVRLDFDDGHDSGIYTWQHLRDLGDNQDTHWQQYLHELAVAKASRLPASEAVAEWQPVKLLDP